MVDRNKYFSIAHIQSVYAASLSMEMPLSAPPGFQCAAVVIPLLIENQQTKILFTKRTRRVRDHQNQISFPGGKCEAYDISFLDTAIREMKEEVGIQIPKKYVLGALKPRKTVTGYFITPFIPYIGKSKMLEINQEEVIRIIKVPMGWLANPANFSIKPYKREQFFIEDVIFYHAYAGEIIWGITARIVQDFLVKIRKSGV